MLGGSDQNQEAAEDVGMADDVAADQDAQTIGNIGGGDDEDVLTIGDVGSGDDDDGHRCGGAIYSEWPLNDAVTTGAVSSSDEGDYMEATVDASAGGMQAAASNPFVYLRLDTGERVEITDHESLDDTTWDLAFKRVVIRTNSDDSGPGDVTVAKISGTTFEDAHGDHPDLSSTAVDHSFDNLCTPMTDPIGNLFTAFNYLNANNEAGTQSWYEYGGGGGMGVSPVDGDVYILHHGERGASYKLELLGWDSGTYTLRWAELDQ